MRLHSNDQSVEGGGLERRHLRMSILQYYKVNKKLRSNDELCLSSGILPDSRGPLSDKIPTVDKINIFIFEALNQSKHSSTF